MDSPDTFSSANYERSKNNPLLEKLRLPDKDRIRWVEHELLRARFAGPMEKSAIAESPEDLESWLARRRDGKSWKEIGDRVYANKGLKPETRRTEARRAYGRVELYFEDPHSKEFREHRLKKTIREVFEVSVDEFRHFVTKGQLPRIAKRKRRSA